MSREHGFVILRILAVESRAPESAGKSPPNSMRLILDHIGILTPSLERSAGHFPPGFTLHEAELMPSEGTREQYATLDSKRGPSVLLLEAIQPGPYQRALDKRGPGLHHLGLATDSLQEATAALQGLGLLLHPVSLTTHSHSCVWMCRPGVPFLVELYKPGDFVSADHAPVHIELPLGQLQGEPIPQLLTNLTVRADGAKVLSLTIDGQVFPIPT